MSFDVAALRASEFPITQEYVYLLNCGIAPAPARTARRVQDFVQQSMQRGVLVEFDWHPELEHTRTSLAQLINASADEIAFIKNTSEGLNIVAQAVPWQRGDVVLVAQDEFPATIYPWQVLQPAGVEVVQVPHSDERITPELFAPYIERGNVRLLALSWVQFHTGWRADLAAFSRMCRDAGVLLCVDVIQGLGALPLDVQATPLDFCMWGGNKWMLSLQGAGGLYVSSAVRDQLQPANVGWLGVNWPEIEHLDPATPLQERAARYEEGTRPNICIAALQQSTNLILELGPQAIADHIKQLTDYLVAGLHDLGAEVRSQRDGDHWSGIVAWQMPGRDLQQLQQDLMAQKIITSVREGSLRAAPHCYNDRSDIDRLLQAIA